VPNLKMVRAPRDMVAWSQQSGGSTGRRQRLFSKMDVTGQMDLNASC